MANRHYRRRRWRTRQLRLSRDCKKKKCAGVIRRVTEGRKNWRRKAEDGPAHSMRKIQSKTVNCDIQNKRAHSLLEGIDRRGGGLTAECLGPGREEHL